MNHQYEYATYINVDLLKISMKRTKACVVVVVALLKRFLKDVKMNLSSTEYCCISILFAELLDDKHLRMALRDFS